MQEKVFLSVVMSQYNELNNLKNGSINRLHEYLLKQDYSWEIVIVDDGSIDGSRDYTEKLNLKGIKYFKADHKGKAGGLNRAINEASGEWILMTDIDQSTPIKEVEKLLKFKEEFNVIIGSRGVKRVNNNIIRKLAGFIFSTLRRVLILNHIVDTQCGFKLFKANLLKNLFPKLEVVNSFKASGWNVTAFDVELLFMCEKTGNKIKEIEVLWKNEDISDSKDRKFVKESLDMFKQISKVFINNIKGKYKDLLV